MEPEIFSWEKGSSEEAASAAGGCWELNVSWKTKHSGGAGRWKEKTVKNQRRAELRGVEKHRTRGTDGKYDQQMVHK